MPDLNKMPVPKYSADQPYHWEYDNLPLQALEDRDVAINNAVDQQTQILVDAAGTQGNIANRLDQSIDDDGNLKSLAIDDAMHNIAKHSDGTTTVDSEDLDFYITTLGYSAMVNPVSFVRMLEAERGKLALIAEEATNLKIQVCTENQGLDSTCTAENSVNLFDDGTLKLRPSDSIHWEFESPNIIRPVLSASLEFAHRHYYDITPISLTDFFEGDIAILYKSFSVTSTNTAYTPGSLRVYLNGVRLSSDLEVYYPPAGDQSTLNFSKNPEIYPSSVDTVPSQPLNLSGSPANGSVVLSWSAPASNGGSSITNYVYQYSINNGLSWSIAASTNSTSTTYTVGGLTNGKGYVFRIAAVNIVGRGPYTTPTSGVWSAGKWLTNRYTEDPTGGTFTLLNAITESDVIKIDFDICVSNLPCQADQLGTLSVE
jgi:hypothetical protein